MTRACDGLARFIDAALVLGGALVCVMVFANVLARYLLDFDLAWVNEIGETAFVWLTFLGGARAVRSHAHLGVVEVVERFPPGLSRGAFVVLWILTAVLLIGLIWYGAGIAIENMGQTMSVTGWPVGVMYAAMPVGSLLALAFVVEQILAGDDFASVVAGAYAVAEEVPDPSAAPDPHPPVASAPLAPASSGAAR